MMMPESSVIVDSSDEGDEYCYSVKIINPQKKSDYSLRKWRHVSKRFPSVESMQSQLIKDFGDVLPSRKEDIELGCIKPGHGAKGRTQWIFTEEDLDDMYKEHAEKTEIIIWIYRYQEKELTTKKRARSPTAQESTKKRKSSVVNTQKLLEVEEIVDKLKTKHEGKYTIEQINVWAHLIHMKKTQSYMRNLPINLFLEASLRRQKIKNLLQAVLVSLMAFHHQKELVSVPSYWTRWKN